MTLCVWQRILTSNEADLVAKNPASIDAMLTTVRLFFLSHPYPHPTTLTRTFSLSRPCSAHTVYPDAGSDIVLLVLHRAVRVARLILRAAGCDFDIQGFEIPSPRLVIHLQPNMKGFDFMNGDPFEYNETVERLDRFIGDHIIPLAARTNAIIIGDMDCHLMQSITKMTALRRARWHGSVRHQESPNLLDDIDGLRSLAALYNC